MKENNMLALGLDFVEPLCSCTQLARQASAHYDVDCLMSNRLKDTGIEKPVHEGEETLRLMLERAGFHNFSLQRRIDLGLPAGTTNPDFFFEDPNSHFEGICLYLDGMSRNRRGESSTARRDGEIRELLRARFYEVIEITFTDLTDREAMSRHFFRLGRALLGRDAAERVRKDENWFVSTGVLQSNAAGTPSELQPGIVSAVATDDWEECLSLLPNEWLPLARALKASGLPAPSDVDWEIVVEGRVGDSRAVMIWRGATGLVGLVSVELRKPEWIAVTQTSDPKILAPLLKQRIGELG